MKRICVFCDSSEGSGDEEMGIVAIGSFRYQWNVDSLALPECRER